MTQGWLNRTGKLRLARAVLLALSALSVSLGARAAPDADELFVMFADATSGKETYGAGRFMYLKLPQDGRVQLDFNKAYNPPCAFNDFATCPLPPFQNRLTLRVDAGEKNYAGAHTP